MFLEFQLSTLCSSQKVQGSIAFIYVRIQKSTMLFIGWQDLGKTFDKQ